jgi:branched-chain amino acid aminotransferase
LKVQENNTAMTVICWKCNSEKNRYWLEKVNEAENLDEASGRLASGVYTTFRTYQHNKALRLEDHFDRLEKSAALQGKPIAFERYLLRKALRDVVNQFKDGDSRLRIHCAYEADHYEIYLMGEPFTPIPDETYKSGVSVKSLDIHRENPISKATSFIEQTQTIRMARPAEIHEYIMVDDSGRILEGLTSNIFIIRTDKIWTAEKGILPGITRQIVLEVIAGSGIEVIFEGYPLREIASADEAFLTSASRGVLPVSRFNDRSIGTGMPGNLTIKIKENYEKWLQSGLRSV